MSADEAGLLQEIQSQSRSPVLNVQTGGPTAPPDIPPAETTWQTPPSTWSEAFWLASALLVGFSVRLAVVLQAWNRRPTFDELDYVNLAKHLNAGYGVLAQDGFERPPGYVYFLSLHHQFFPSFQNMTRLSQLLLAVLAQVFLFLIVKPALGPRVALASVWLFALNADLAFITGTLRPEALYPCLLLGSLAILLREVYGTASSKPAPPRWIFILVGGLLYGAGCLVRSVGLSLLPFLLLWLLFAMRSRAQALKIGLVFAAGMLLAISPWTARNYARYHRLILVDQGAGFNLMLGNNVHMPPNWDVRRRISSIGYAECKKLELPKLEECNKAQALRFIRENPGLFLQRIPLKMADLWNPYRGPAPSSGLSPKSIKIRSWPDWGWRIASFVLVSIAAVLGMALPFQPEHPRAGRMLLILVAGLTLHTLLLHSLTFGIIRFRLPLMPFLFLPAARALVDWRRFGLLLKPSRLIFVVLVLGTLFWLWSWQIQDIHSA